LLKPFNIRCEIDCQGVDLSYSSPILIFVHENAISEFEDFLTFTKSKSNLMKIIFLTTKSTSFKKYYLKKFDFPFAIIDLKLSMKEILTRTYFLLFNNSTLPNRKNSIKFETLIKNKPFITQSIFNLEELKIIKKLSILFTNKEIADACEISVSTLKRKLIAIAKKANVTNCKASILKFAMENQLYFQVD
jgi:DNA-binding NarL/FixJ family response regulator